MACITGCSGAEVWMMARLSHRGIMSRPYFWPIHLQKFYIEQFARFVKRRTGKSPTQFRRGAAVHR